MSIIGLDVGEHSFRAVEVEKSKDGYQIINFGHFENSQLNRSKIGLNKEIHSTALTNFFSEFGFTSQNVVLGIDDTNIFMRVISIPNMSDSDISSTINYEAEKYIPLPINQVNLTYQKIKSSENSDTIDVQIIAARTSKLKEYVDVVKKANLVPFAIEPETLAISRALVANNDVDGSIIIDIGFSYTMVIVYLNNIVHFTRTIPYGGDHITRILQEKLDLEYYQAEEYKKTYGIDKSYFDGKIHNIIKPVIDNIILDINRTLLFFSKRNNNVSIKKAIITGGGSMLPGFLMYLVSSLDIEVILGDPLKKISLSPNLTNRKDILINSANLYTTSIGLALKV